MDRQELAAAINGLLARDKEFQELYNKVEQYEPEHQRILAALSPEDRELLELYIAACEEAQYYRIYPAYRLGRLAGGSER